MLTPGSFSVYPPEAQSLATGNIALLSKLPLPFLPLLLRELITYDWKFPAERLELTNQLTYLKSLSPDQLSAAMQPFAQLRLSSELERSNWITAPDDFSEKLTAHLWATHQIDTFRKASVDYVHALNLANPVAPLPTHRLGIVLIGSAVSSNRYPLFRKLRPHGTYLTNVDPEGARAAIHELLNKRVAQNPEPFAHWYIEGDRPSAATLPLTTVSYASLTGVRESLVNRMRAVMQPGAGGPEALRSLLARMTPSDVGLAGPQRNPVLDRFQLSILTQGSGTQLFSTTFVQWTAREALRRAQPLTLYARFTPRQREDSMRDLVSGTPHQPVPDPDGSLIDADMGAYYTWINQQRLPGADQARFLVCFEDHHEALAIAPGLKAGTENPAPITFSSLLSRIAQS